MYPTLITAKRLTIHLTWADHFHEQGHTNHTPLGTELLLRAHRAGMAGATTVHGAEGFGLSNKIHRQPVWGLIDRAPIIVMIVDSADRIDGFVAANQELFRECLATVSDLKMIPRPHGVHHPSRGRA